MPVEDGPKNIQNLTPRYKVANFETSSLYPTLLMASTQKKLQSFHLQLNKKAKSKVIPIKSYELFDIPSLMSISEQNTIVHCQESSLLINNKKQIKHKDRVNHLLVDDAQIALTTTLDNIHITSLEKNMNVGELHDYGSLITSLYWKNSLAISGDQQGSVKLWDINKEKIIHRSTIYTTSVDHLSAFSDFIHTNFYYSLSKRQRKITFHDLRTFKPIKTTPNLPFQLINIKHNQSGKIFLSSKKKVEVIDVYQGFQVMGSFSQLKGQALENMLIRCPEGQKVERQLTDLYLWKQFVLVGCDNGCIEIYNSDTFECLYGYGVFDCAVQKIGRIDSTLIVLSVKGGVSLVHFK